MSPTDARRKRSTRLYVTGIVLLVFASGFVAYSVFVYGDTVHSRRVDNARTALQNCQQIELIKTQIRASVTASQQRLPTIAYYRTHPRELRQALKDSRASITRFHAVDCYQLPAVRAAGLHHPRR
jgi:hypothetical protein